MPLRTTIYLCPHTVCSRYRSPHICVLRLLHMCPHTTIHNASLYCNMHVSSYGVLPLSNERSLFLRGKQASARGKRKASWTHILTLLFVCVLRLLHKRLPSLYYYVSYATQVCSRYRSLRGHTTTPPCRLWCAKKKKALKMPSKTRR